jgi:hypothetical protein
VLLRLEVLHHLPLILLAINAITNLFLTLRLVIELLLIVQIQNSLIVHLLHIIGYHLLRLVMLNALALTLCC